MMTAYDPKRLTEQEFNRKKGESRHSYTSTSNKNAKRRREFLMFLDLILGCELVLDPQIES